MSDIDILKKRLDLKIVYYGPTQSGKAQNLQIIAEKTPLKHHEPLTSVVTQNKNATFRYMRLNFPLLKDIETTCKLFTIPGAHDEATCKLILHRVDGIVFVADSRAHRQDENRTSLASLEKYLEEYGLDIKTIPLVFQWNHRDDSDAIPVDVLEKEMNHLQRPSHEAIAHQGIGVFPSLKSCITLAFESIKQRCSNLYPELFSKDAHTHSLVSETFSAPSNYDIKLGERTVSDEEWAQWLQVGKALLKYKEKTGKTISMDDQNIRKIFEEENVFLSDFFQVGKSLESAYEHYREEHDLDMEYERIEREIRRLEHVLEKKKNHTDKQYRILQNRVESDEVLRRNVEMIKRNPELPQGLRSILHDIHLDTPKI
ncbi:GTP-binding protein [Candidatus Uabimicrobium amorphum]|uniref:Cell polarity determinant GTPase MglA n=1 Tax=Uabimicrobium amorphum TaxID=2596890 RepID=A0A5S9F6E8_UABAM|nr:hypothetical protein [Candidatus Uabimicrobium amorphum]BBM87815.1 cell polarity determinant GTPase MglA [Candidatus Uabimicrobium amorphum]